MPNRHAADEILSAGASLTDWIAMVRAEFLEFPGLSLSGSEMHRLWDLEPEILDAILNRLIASGFLIETPTGMYERPRSTWEGRERSS